MRSILSQTIRVLDFVLCSMLLISAQANTQTRVEVLVAYTDAAANSVTSITGLILDAINETNTSYTNSNISIYMWRCAVVRVDYTETGNIVTDLARFQGSGDGFMDEIHSLRDACGADLCVLIVSGSEENGLTSPGAPNASAAFSVMNVGGVTADHVFAHETGHQFGALHQIQVDATPGTQHAYQYPSGNWRTVMSTSSPSCTSCVRILRWSDPSNYYNGVLIGDQNSNNREWMNDHAATVAAFRSSNNIYVPEDHSTISSALAAAQSGQRVVVNVGSYTIQGGDLVVASGVALQLNAGATVNLNGYSIVTSAGTISVLPGATLNGIQAYLKRADQSIKGLYATIQSACNAAANGDVVDVLTGTYNIASNLTISSGVTLQIASGSTLNFTGNYKLRVEGTLNADGVTFTRSGGQWYGIEFYGGSGTVNGCTIENASYGAYVYACWYPYITRCTIQNNTTGIASIGSSHLVGSNYITGNTYGVSCSDYSYLDFQMNNWVKFNTRGVQIDATSPPALGTYNTPVYCSIWGNDWDIWSDYSGTINAEWNYWGDYPANPMVYGTVDYANALMVEPGLWKRAVPAKEVAAGSKGSVVAENTSGEGGISDTTGIGELDQARALEAGSRATEAETAFSSLIARHPDKPASLIALAHLAHLRETTGGNALASLSTYATSYIGSTLGDFAQVLTGQIFIRQGATDGALGIFKDVTMKTGSPFEAEALYNAGCLLWYRKEAKAEGEGYFRTLIEKYPKSVFTQSALATLGELPEGKEPSKETATGPEAPASYNLSSAYPNPFNPSTTLKYALPALGKVSLIVYDVLGRQVAVLARGPHEAGYHSATWNAASASSGTYFAMLLVTDDLGQIKYKQVNKLLLVK
jgi:parallel beta-helix repeat protein